MMALWMALLGPEKNGVPTTEFAELYQQHADFLVRGAHQLGVPSEIAPDLVHDTFLVLHQRWSEARSQASIRAWLYGVLRNLNRNRRRKKDGVLADLSTIEDQGLSADQLADQQAQLRRLNMCLSQLPEHLKETFVLSELEELTPHEIADATSTNINTVYARVRKAKESMQTLYAQSFEQMFEREGDSNGPSQSGSIR